MLSIVASLPTPKADLVEAAVSGGRLRVLRLGGFWCLKETRKASVSNLVGGDGDSAPKADEQRFRGGSGQLLAGGAGPGRLGGGQCVAACRLAPVRDAMHCAVLYSALL